MNSLICLLTVFHILALVQQKVFIAKGKRRLVYLGIVLPLGDYVLRFFLGELWFYSGNLIFHSFFYQGLFWCIVVLLFWIYSRDLRSSIKFLLPLSGLGFYYICSLFSTDELFFGAPFFSGSFHLDWISSGYLIPSVFALFLWLIKRWSEMSVKTISRLSLCVLAAFIIIAGIIRFKAENAAAEKVENYNALSIMPANSLLTEWSVVFYADKSYYSQRFHFVQGWQGQPEKAEAFDNFAVAQKVLNNPSIRRVYLYGFKNPIIKIEFQNEALFVTISEFKPLIDFLWIKQIKIIHSRSNQVVDMNVQYGTII
ncbi:hypothetical protein KJ966_18645 [bacterium]|nr:hypothetical protein [bacterium]